MGQLLKDKRNSHETTNTVSAVRNEMPLESYAFFDVLTQLTLEQKRQRAAQRAAAAR